MGRNVFPELYKPNRHDPNDLSHLPPELQEIYRRNTARLGVARHRQININVTPVYECSCCGEKHVHLDIEQKVAITPDGALDPLPVIGTVSVSASTLDTAIAVFDELFEEYEDMLVASVVNMSVTDVLDTVDRGDWEWNQSTHRYRNTQTNRVITENTLIGLRDNLVESWRGRVQSLADDLVAGRLTIQEWTFAMRREVSNIFSSEYLLAKGGRNAIFQADLDAIQEMLTTQYSFLQNFAEEVRAGDLSQAQIAARAELYMESATQSHERGKAARHGLVLPQYPGDGSQICGARCKCRWDIDETDDEYLCTWLLNALPKHCDSCLSNAATWKPLIIPKG